MENIGRRVSAPPFKSRRNKDFDTIDIYGAYGMDRLYRILGYTENPPVMANYPCVAIMFEDLHTFEKIWWHYEQE